MPSPVKRVVGPSAGQRFCFWRRFGARGKILAQCDYNGGKEEAFSAKGYNKYPLEQILQPFELTAALCQMHWIEPLVLYWSRNVSDIERYEHAELYRRWLNNPLENWEATDQGGQYGDNQ